MLGVSGDSPDVPVPSRDVPHGKGHQVSSAPAALMWLGRRTSLRHPPACLLVRTIAGVLLDQALCSFALESRYFGVLRTCRVF